MAEITKDWLAFCTGGPLEQVASFNRAYPIIEVSYTSKFHYNSKINPSQKS